MLDIFWGRGFPDSLGGALREREKSVCLQGVGCEELAGRCSRRRDGKAVGGTGGGRRGPRGWRETPFRHVEFKMSIHFAEMSRRPLGIF